MAAAIEKAVDDPSFNMTGLSAETHLQMIGRSPIVRFEMTFQHRAENES